MILCERRVEWIDASVTEVRRSEGEDLLARKYIMILAERDHGRRLPMWIGPAEATAFALALESAEAHRRLRERYGATPSMR